MAGMRVLVTGIDGYIGAILGSRLLEQGFDVVGIDCGFYRDGWLYNDLQSRPLTLSKDVRRLRREDVEAFDAVVHLAELSNDPLGELSKPVTYDINHLGSVALARTCKEAGVPRFVYTSSCSVYGAADDGGERTEQSPPEPADRLCPVQNIGRARGRPPRGFQFFAGISSQCHRIRCQPAHALRYRSQ